MKVMVLGASGMIGSAMFRVLSEDRSLDVVGVLRTRRALAMFSEPLQHKCATGGDLAQHDTAVALLMRHRPDVVINCVGLTKHLPEGNDPVSAMTLNALMPHRLARLCVLGGTRFIHVSTDCVFSGSKGSYTEEEPTDALDVYGRTKSLGEVVTDGALTLRTSTIGHEYQSRYGLLEWFLAQTECDGYQRAVFSGLPSVEFARIVRDIVLPAPDLTGLYHVGGEPIDKASLLMLISKVYGKNTVIHPDSSFCIDRSLDSSKFTHATGYRAPAWPELIAMMYQHR